jgi:transcriptional regulator with XRE-family HTH domain
MEFAETLRRLRLKARKSRYKLAQWTGLSEAYLLRLENGERSNPGRDVVLLISLALVSGSEGIDLYDIEELMLSAGYAPLRKRGEVEAISASSGI